MPAVVIGDFNVNPYEPGMIMADKLHAVPAKPVAARGRRTIMRKSYPMFYNPSWRLYAEGEGGPGGTYFRATNDVDCVFWNVFDQVLVRPALLPRLPIDCVRVIDKDESVGFRRQPAGTPDERISDHLPILFTMH